MTDSEYVLALIDEAFASVPEVKAHHDRMRLIAGKLSALEFMANGLTRAKTEATPSCAGLSEYKWVEHKGSDCPVNPRTMVHVRLRDGQESEHPQPAKEWIWDDALNDATISHYLVIR